MIYILNDAYNDYRIIYFPSTEYRCVFGFEFTIMENNEEDVLTFTLEHMNFKPQFMAQIKKSKTLESMETIPMEYLNYQKKIIPVYQI